METKYRKGDFLSDQSLLERYYHSRSLLDSQRVEHGGELPATTLDSWIQDFPNAHAILELLNGETQIEPVTAAFYAHMTPAELLAWGENNLKVLADGANYSTVRAFPSGFNKHDFEGHIKPIGQDAIRFAEEWGIDQEELKSVMMADLFHDTGMLFSRKDHPLISPIIFGRLLPELSKSSIGQAIRHLILNHDDGIFTHRIGEWLCLNPHWKEEDIYLNIQNKISKPAMFLIVLDKVQLGIERVRPRDHGIII
jgi:hypothetical protein